MNIDEETTRDGKRKETLKMAAGVAGNVLEW
jgi:hypothetical protein